MAKLTNKIILGSATLFVLAGWTPALVNKVKLSALFKQETFDDKVNALKAELSQFSLATGNFDVKDEYASKYANNPTYIKSSLNTPKGESNFWKNQLLFSSLLNNNDLNQNKIFGLNHPKGHLLNIYQDKYNISFYSYASDLTGTLYLRVIFNPKKSTYLNTQVDYIYKLEGFKKYDKTSYSEGMFIKDVNFVENLLTNYPTLDEFEQAYNQASDDATKTAFYNKVFNYYGASDSSAIIPSSITLSFDKENNTVIFHSRLRAVINDANLDNLNNITTQDTNINGSFRIKYPVPKVKQANSETSNSQDQANNKKSG